MERPACWWRRRGKAILFCFCVLLTGLAVSGAWVLTEPADKLTPEQQRLLIHARDLKQQADQLHQRGRYAEATKLFKELVPILEGLYSKAKYPQGHPELATSLNDLGVLLQEQGEYGLARPYLERALAMREALYPRHKLPQGHPELATSLSNLGILLYMQGEYGLARPDLERALAMREALYPRDKFPQGHPDLATSLFNLGMLLQWQGEYGPARSYQERALDMSEALYPRNKYPQGHPDVARSLRHLGGLLTEQADYVRARTYIECALAMDESLYPKAQYPHGHPDLVASLSNMGLLLRSQGEYRAACLYLERGLAMDEALFPREKFPQGHPHLVASLINLGLLLTERGEYGAGRPYLERALSMDEALYPKDKYPQGHPNLANSLANLGGLLQHQGEYGPARTYLERALSMDEALYPKDKYPQGHPHLASSLNNLGTLLQDQGEYGPARTYFERALAMREALYPKDKYPQGHPDLASSLNNLGRLLQDQGQYGLARPNLARTLAMYEALYPKDKYPQGHPHLAISLNNLGALLQDQGEYGPARIHLERALALWEALYPKDKYPQGHPHLATSLNNLGLLLQAQGEYGPAQSYCERAMVICRDLNETFVATASEAEAMNRPGCLPLVPYLSVTRHLDQTVADSYRSVWGGKGAVSRLLERRRQLLLTADPDCRDLARQLADARQALAVRLLAPAGSRRDAADGVQKLTERKEELERQLGRKLSAFNALLERARFTPDDLLRHLPAHTAFVDFVRYVYFEQDSKVSGKAGEKRTPCYVAFVLRHDQPIQRVELGEATPIEDAVAEWRLAILDQKASSAAETLRRKVWEPLTQYLPADTQTVLLAPDAALTGLPWAALPGAAKGTVLLEDYALAIVPHGQFLLEQLRAEPAPDKQAGLLLAVGDVRYDAEGKVVDPGPIALARSPALDDKHGLWKPLAATGKELEEVLALAGKRQTLSRRGAEACTAQLLLDLPQARWAHLATHGFFADKKFRSVLQLDEDDYKRGLTGFRAKPGARNPLVLSGVVLAGANLPPKEAKDGAPPDNGILTAEAIAGLRLDNLELVVLSACETGLGEVAGGEGVFGLQRAFHVAGAHNVVASLWKVNDEATAALMGLFYHKLWGEGKPPLQALREAQLYLYRHPDQIQTLAQTRAPDFDKVVQRPAEKPAEGVKDGEGAPAHLWAGFVLSGLGR
jgi:CHAT domain-containing protein/Tfp pilus assembly protein PilF